MEQILFSCYKMLYVSHLGTEVGMKNVVIIIYFNDDNLRNLSQATTDNQVAASSIVNLQCARSQQARCDDNVSEAAGPGRRRRRQRRWREGQPMLR